MKELLIGAVAAVTLIYALIGAVMVHMPPEYAVTMSCAE